MAVAFGTPASSTSIAAALASTSAAIGLRTAAKSAVALYINNPTGPGMIIRSGATGAEDKLPFAIAQGDGQVKQAFSSAGAYYTNAFMYINGGWSATFNATTGLFETFNNAGASGISTMLELVSDVDGPNFVTKHHTGSSATHWIALDDTLNEEFRVAKLGHLKWADSAGGVSDVGFSRKAAKVLEVNDGTAGNAGYIRTPATTVTNLPSAATAGAGARGYVTDATQTLTAGIGATVAGTGANSVPVVSDGTNWKIG